MKLTKELRKISIARTEKLIVLVIASIVRDQPEYFYCDPLDVDKVIKNSKAEGSVIQILRVSPNALVYNSLDGTISNDRKDNKKTTSRGDSEPEKVTHLFTDGL